MVVFKRRQRAPRRSQKAKLEARRALSLLQSEPIKYEIEYVNAPPDSLMMEIYGDVVAKFTPMEEVEEINVEEEEEIEEEMEEEEEEETEAKSKRRRRRENRPSVAELKQYVEKPEVVEWVDTCAADPKLLVEIKSLPNVIQVPSHWSQKRKYLHNKRGIEKRPFELPEYIKATGIQIMREAVDRSDATLKQKTRERMQPKVGKHLIDYAKLHDAFFKWQTKPPLTLYGETYYEGKEYETRLHAVRPGGPLTPELCEALGMPPLSPPPWLINMQRYGPPPSYPGLKIPGLNAPIPQGAQWGFQIGGWGKPPVDEFGRPLYGDVFGPAYDPNYVNPYAAPIQRETWGEIPREDYDNESEYEPAAESADEEIPAQFEIETEPPKPTINEQEVNEIIAELAAPAIPKDFDLRKSKPSDTPLYTVLPEKPVAVSGMMGSDKVYDIAGKEKQEPAKPKPERKLEKQQKFKF